MTITFTGGLVVLKYKSYFLSAVALDMEKYLPKTLISTYKFIGR
jgi:hypothetical protein